MSNGVVLKIIFFSRKKPDLEAKTCKKIQTLIVNVSTKTLFEANIMFQC